MGLFDKIVGENDTKEIDDQEKKEEFNSIILETENVPREIRSIAAANKLASHELDFKILKTKTLYSIEKEEGWVEADETQLRQFKDKDFILSPDLKVKQSFKVDIFKKAPQDDKEYEKLPNIVMGANKLMTKVIVSIKKDIEVKYFSKLEERILEEINKKKIRSGIVVGIRDENMKKEVKKLVSGIRVNGILDKDATFVVCEGVDPAPPVHDDFIFHYKKKMGKEDEHGRVDYSKRGYILAVEENECIMEYIKPQEGVPGRNCQGKFISVKPPKDDSEIQINHTENITKKEDDEKIRYIANRNGYVTQDGDKYDIDDNMEVEEVSFRSTGSIETDLSSNVKINIKESDVFKDAIGPGMTVETYELSVDGNVASGAKIKTEKLVIGGQTHKTAVMNSKTANISVHRGTVTADEVQVERLEGGKIVGDHIQVQQAIGGEIIGKEIVIDKLGSNVSITASDRIEIKEMKGSNNKFLIDPSGTREFNETIERINKQIKEIDIKLKPLEKKLDERKRLIAKTKPTVETVKEKIAELKSDGKKPPATLLSKIREYQNLINVYNASLKEYKNDKLTRKNLKEDLKQVQDKVFSAKIINHSPWQEFNEIKFKLISPPVEKVYSTKNHEIIREFSLKETGEGKYEIQKSSEYTE